MRLLNKNSIQARICLQQNDHKQYKLLLIFQITRSLFNLNIQQF